MKKIIKPGKENWAELVARPQINNNELVKICREVFAEIMKDGDLALKKYTWFFDRVRLDDFTVSREALLRAEALVAPELKQAIVEAKKNIEAFHVLQKSECKEYINPEGFRCWQEVRGIEKVGLYIPGGSAPLFSTVLMLAIPARLAGCREIVLCTPPDLAGEIDPVILWTAQLCGVTRIYKAGGIQAIGAMTWGTETIPRVNKIFGPGNQYVMAAKQLACNYGIAIDMPAGPSEVMVVADKTANPAFIAADLLSQAEHGPDSQVILLTTDAGLLPEVEREVEKQLTDLPRKAIIIEALQHARLILLESMEECVDLMNEYAPEHLILCVENYPDVAHRVINAGSVFLGNYSPESAGDYASGTNHTLPTNGYAKAYSGVNLDAFVRKITFQEIKKEGLKVLAPIIETMAENEQLMAHSKAVKIRFENTEK